MNKNLIRSPIARVEILAPLPKLITRCYPSATELTLKVGEVIHSLTDAHSFNIYGFATAYSESPIRPGSLFRGASGVSKERLMYLLVSFCMEDETPQWLNLVFQNKRYDAMIGQILFLLGQHEDIPSFAANTSNFLPLAAAKLGVILAGIEESEEEVGLDNQILLSTTIPLSVIPLKFVLGSYKTTGKGTPVLNLAGQSKKTLKGDVGIEEIYATVRKVVIPFTETASPTRESLEEVKGEWIRELSSTRDWVNKQDKSSMTLHDGYFEDTDELITVEWLAESTGE